MIGSQSDSKLISSFIENKNFEEQIKEFREYTRNQKEK